MKIINNFPKITKIDNINNEVITKAPIDHASGNKSYGAGSDARYGHVKLSDSYTSSDGVASEGIAASSKAVADLYNHITNDFIKTYDIDVKLGSQAWTASYNGKFYTYIDLSSLYPNKILSVSTIGWTGMRTTDIITAGFTKNNQLEIDSSVNTFAHSGSNIVVRVVYI